MGEYCKTKRGKRIGETFGCYTIIEAVKEENDFKTSLYKVKCNVCGKVYERYGKRLQNKPKNCKSCSRHGKPYAIKYEPGMVVGKYEILSSTVKRNRIKVYCTRCGWKGEVNLSIISNMYHHPERYTNQMCSHRK